MTPIEKAGPLAWIDDVIALTRRNVIGLRRKPEMIVFSLLQPILFVLLFTQVFGGAINVQGSDYTDYLLAGIFGQTMVFASVVCGLTMAQDLQVGIIDRFRSLPMHPSAILMACTLSNLIVSAFSILAMVVTGLIVGWRFHLGVPRMLLGVALLLAFAWAFSWVMVAISVALGDPRTLNTAGVLLILPMSFLSNAFVPLESMSGWVRVVAEWNPVSALVQACRELFGNLGSAAVPEVWPLQHPTVATVGHLVLIVAVFAPLSAWVFRVRANR